MKKIALFSLLLAYSLYSFAQEQDSLLQLVASEIPTKQKVDIYNQLAFRYVVYDSVSTAKYTRLAIDLAKEINYKIGESDALYAIGWVTMVYGHNSKAIELFERVVDISTEAKYKKGEANGFNGLGDAFRNQGDYSNALNYHLKSLRIKEGLGDSARIASSLNNIGNIYLVQQDHSKAKQYYKQSLDIRLKQGDKRQIAVSYNNMGIVSVETDSYKEALDYYGRCIMINKEIGAIGDLAKNYYNIGVVYADHIKDYKQALIFFSKALETYKSLGDKSSITYPLVGIAQVYVNMQNWNKAKNYVINAIKLSKKAELSNILYYSYEILATIEKNLGNYNAAYEASVNYKILGDELKNVEQTRRLTKLEAEYQFQNERDSINLVNEKEKIVMNQRLQDERTRNYFAIIGVIALAILSFILFRYLQLRKKAQRVLLDKNLEIQQQKEELLATNEKLIELDEFKQGMTGMIVHDLKNPLNGIINVSNSYSSEKRIQRMQQIGKQMLNMVLNILDVHKYEETRLLVDKLDCSLLALSQNAINEVGFLADQKNIAISNTLAAETGVKVDQEIIERVFVNILTNAIKYTPNNGNITVGSRKSEVGSQVQTENWRLKSEGYVEISIRDTGQGIPQDQLPRVFDKFEQLSAKKSGKIRSTGLGLTFCKMAVEAHGGEIGVESHVENPTNGKTGGTTFWFTLPSANINPSEDHEIKESTLTQISALSLTANDKKILEPFVMQFKKCEIYKVSILRKLLKQIEAVETENIKNWKESMHKAIRSGNEKIFEELINETA